MEEEPTSITPSGRLVRLFVIGLPLGLIVMGALSFVFYFEKKNRPAPVSSQLSVMLRRDINTEDFARYMRILGQEVGVRNEMHRDNLQAASAFVDSTMGYDNMGYHVKRQDFTVAGQVLTNLIVELTGKLKPRETVLVLANYDSTEMNLPAESAGAAALFSLAHAVTGTLPDRTIRFAAVVNARAKDPRENGCSVLASELASEGNVVTHVLALSPLFTDGGLPPEWSKAVVQTMTLGDETRDPTALMSRLNSMKATLEQLADVR